MIATIVTRHSPAVRSHLANRGAWNPVLPSIEPQAAPVGGEVRKRVLVVDDENLIADSIAEILNRNGFDAVARYDAESVMRSLSEAPGPDIMLMDVVMPRLNGIELAKAVRSIHPAIRILLLSGNVATSRMLNDASAEGFLFEILAKPLHPSRLLKVLSA
jgi:DNA-binding NtrC family response regulator